MLGSRFRKEGWEEPGIAFVKSLTTKPVVGVGRFTSPDANISQDLRAKYSPLAKSSAPSARK